MITALFNAACFIKRGKAMGLLFLLGLIYGVAKAQPPTLRFEHITSENGLPQNTIHGIVKDKYGFMWFGTWSGLCRYDGYRFKIYRNEPGNPKSINNNRIHNIIKDAEGNLWILTFEETTLCKYNYTEDNFDRIPAQNVAPSFIHKISRRDHHKNINFTYGDTRWNMEDRTNFLIQTQLSTHQSTIVVANPAKKWALNDPYATDLYLDDQNILWVGTYSNGLNKANLKAKPFQYYAHDPKDKNSIIDNNIRAISEDRQSNLWIGSRDKGISIIGKKGTTHLQFDKANSQTINSDQIKKLFCDSKGLMWIGTKKGLDRFDPSTGRIRHFDAHNLKNISVFGITEDHAGNIWIGSWKGIQKYVPASDSIVYYNPDPLLKNKHVITVLEDSHHLLWVGTEGGGVSVLSQTASGDLKLKAYLNHTETSRQISDDRVYALYEDKAGFMWIGTGNGLDRYDPHTHAFRHFAASPNGLANATIGGILQDNSGYIWVNHKRGISKIDPKDLSITNYSVQDGLQSNEFTDGAAYKSKVDGRLYFGGNNGYNAFYGEQIKPDLTVPQVVLTELQVLNKPVEVNTAVNGRVLLKHPLYLSKEINLNYDDKSIAIEFAGLHFANPAGNRYAYRLKGFDKDWIYTDASRRLATYSNLSPGDYVFEVKASNSDGIWNPVPKVLHISMSPPWWASTAAYIIYVILIGALLYAFYQYSTRYARLKAKLGYEALLHEKELELRQNKIEFFTNVSHEIKTPLSLILAPIERMMDASNDNKLIKDQLQTMQQSGDRLLKLVNQLLDIRRFETGNDTLKLETGNLWNFIEVIVASFHPIATERRINLRLIKTVPAFETLFDPDKIEKILYNLLSNAFKFTEADGSIQVRLDVAQQQAIIEVTDNGIGINPDDFERIFKPFQQGSSKKGGTGLGLAYTKALVELHGGTIQVSSQTMGQQKGTCFKVAIPVNESQDSLTTSISEASLNLPPDVADAGAPREPLTVLNDGKGPVLLLIEDNQELRDYLKAFFIQHYTLLEASNGLEGMTIAMEQLPDIILSDVMMPEMDGIELSRRLKADAMTSHIPIILLTAKTAVEYQLDGIETGADDYVTKPFNLSILASKINNLLLNRIRLREKYKRNVTVSPTEIDPVSPDDKLLRKVLEMVEQHIADPELGVEQICDQIGLSRTQLYRKMKALTSLSMAELIKEIRLKRAQQLLAGKKFNINEVAYMVGFTDADYFRKCFKAKFGLSPSEYAKNQQAENLQF